MFCPKCGAEADGKFCTHCGADLMGCSETNINEKSETIINNYYKNPEYNPEPEPRYKTSFPKRICPKCNSDHISYQTVVEKKNGGCLMVCLYIFLAFSVVGWIILIPMLLAKRTVTYAVCQSCGYRWNV
jgi:hypothetical protein